MSLLTSGLPARRARSGRGRLQLTWVGLLATVLALAPAAGALHAQGAGSRPRSALPERDGRWHLLPVGDGASFWVDTVRVEGVSRSRPTQTVWLRTLYETPLKDAKWGDRRVYYLIWQAEINCRGFTLTSLRGSSYDQDGREVESFDERVEVPSPPESGLEMMVGRVCEMVRTGELPEGPSH